MSGDFSKKIALLVAAVIGGVLAVSYDGDFYTRFITLFLVCPAAFLFAVKLNKHLFGSSYDIETFEDENHQFPYKTDIVPMMVSGGVIVIVALGVFVAWRNGDASSSGEGSRDVIAERTKT